MSFMDDLVNVCTGFRLVSYYVDELIPKKKMKHARQSFNIPDNKKIIALIDTTTFGRTKTGLVICENGIYWGNEPQFSTIRNFLPWDEFASQIIAINRTFHIEMGKGNIFAAEGFNKNKIVDLLQAIQTCVHKHKQLKLNIADNKELAASEVPPPVPPSQQETWMLYVAGKQMGPYNRAVIKQLIASGVNAKEAYVWKTGMKEWTPFMAIPSLAALLEPSLPSPPLGTNPKTEPEHEAVSPRTMQRKMIDINNSSTEELLGLPGINLAEAQIIAQERKNRNGFTTIDEVGSLLQLQPHIIEKLREIVVFNNYKGGPFSGRIIDF